MHISVLAAECTWPKTTESCRVVCTPTATAMQGARHNDNVPRTGIAKHQTCGVWERVLSALLRQRRQVFACTRLREGEPLCTLTTACSISADTGAVWVVPHTRACRTAGPAGLKAVLQVLATSPTGSHVASRRLTARHGGGKKATAHKTPHCTERPQMRAKRG